jgi:hypothetical protein
MAEAYGHHAGCAALAIKRCLAITDLNVHSSAGESTLGK